MVARRLDRWLDLVPDAAFRVAGALGFGAFAVWQATRYDRYANKVVYALETLIYVLLAVSYLTRRPAAERARGPAEVLLPLVGATMPFAFQLTTEHDPALAWIVMPILLAGNGLSVAGYVFLRRSFSILVEAREPVTRGPYRWIRHPVYAGQIIAMAGVTVFRHSWVNAALLGLFAGVQVARATLEERKIARVFPAYAEYARRTWRFVPFLY
jgi:protein-S-isoprenylcysteine O-methyltransferase Ste14